MHDMNHPPSGEYFGELTPRVEWEGEVGLESQRDRGFSFLACAG